MQMHTSSRHGACTNTRVYAPGARRDCWAVALGNSFDDEERCLLAGYDNGDVKMFDLRTNTVRV